MPWPFTKRVAFRFLFPYLVLYCLLKPLPPNWLSNSLVSIVSQIIGVNAVPPAQMGGSGDTTYHYVEALGLFLLSLVVALLWSVLDRKSAGYPRLYLGLRVLVRISLGMTLIGYGTSKVIQTQFPPPSLSRLLQTFGDASPMGLLWTFMSASKFYNIFTGGAEMLAGVLLFFRRTTLLGALLSIGVLSHICALNFSYDVPVKLFSLHLLGMAVLLAAGDARRLVSFFLMNRAAEPASRQTVLQRPSWQRAVFALKLVALTTLVSARLYSARAQVKVMGLADPKPPLYGIWDTQEFAVDGKALPPLLTDTNRWRRLIIGYPRQVAYVQWMNESRRGFAARVDLPAKKVLLLNEEFAFTQPDSETLLLEGTLNGHAVRARLRRLDDKFQLTTRGFHWINESPYNR